MRLCLETLVTHNSSRQSPSLRQVQFGTGSALNEGKLEEAVFADVGLGATIYVLKMFTSPLLLEEHRSGCDS